MRPHALSPLPLPLVCAALLAACSTAPNALAASPAGVAGISRLEAPQSRAEMPDALHYTVVPLATLGGTVAAGISITDRGSIAGFSTLSGDHVVHAALWEHRTPTDLGTLGGPNSAVEWPNHDEGFVVGISQTSMTDPLGEHWSCSAFIPFTGDTCVGFIWRGGAMQPLPTLGGDNGFASGANEEGSIVGWAETSTHDPTCKPPQVLRFEALEWNPSGKIVDVFKPFGHDPDTAATAVNDAGQVVGISGICQNAVGQLSAKHAMLWQNGRAISIGTLGGRAWNTPTAISDRGTIAGFSDLPGDDPKNPNYHAFFWSSASGIHDLGVLPGDTVSQAFGINDTDEVVGQSCTTPQCSSSSAFIWRDGVMTDLNSLAGCGSPLFLVFANDIDDRGEITGLGVDASGNAVAFRAFPDDEPQTAGARRIAPAPCERRALPESIQRSLVRSGAYAGR